MHTSFEVTITTSGSQLLGKSLTLQCFPSSSTLFSYTWMRCNNQTIISSNSSVTFNPLQLSHQGCYICHVKVHKLVKRRTIDIKVVTDPSKLRTSSQKILCPTDLFMVQFNCDNCKQDIKPSTKYHEHSNL